jgi:starch-binding outer membrane protein SusE/F
MKKQLYFLALLFSLFNSYSQISMIGTALPAEIDMPQFNLYNFQVQATFTTGNVKFRQGHTWDVNWGNSSFPSGTGFQNGADIPVTAGTYIVDFNSATGNYSFTPATPTPIISIVGSGVNGWPPNQVGAEITLTTIDGINYTINNLAITAGLVKFRKDSSWAVNWGGSTFPSGTGIQDGANIPTTAGNYNVTLNIINGTYTFIPASTFPSIGIWGPAVNSQLGYSAPDVNMTTTDGIHYTLSGFYFSSGNCYFRQDDNSSLVWGSTAFPTGTATTSGPSLFVPGSEYYVTFNRLTGEYSFVLPVISIIGTSLLGWDTDVVMTTTDGEHYILYYPAGLTIGECKFRKNYTWDINWAGDQFPSGTAYATPANITIPTSGFDYVTFNRYTLAYSFFGLLSNPNFNQHPISVYPNPTNNNWNISSIDIIKAVEVYDVLGKLVYSTTIDYNDITIDGTSLKTGIYFAKIDTDSKTERIKLIKE